MTHLKIIEKKWIDNFKKSPLVVKESGTFNHVYAYQLFYGKNDDAYPPDYPHNFLEYYNSHIALERDASIDALVGFLHFIGIHVNTQFIKNHLTQFPDDYEKLVRKSYYILKTLAHHNDKLDISNPFFENKVDIFFLLKIQSEESVNGSQFNLFEEIELPELYNKYINIPVGYENDAVAKGLFDKIEHTNESFFITGKAGTGKSTFLHYFARKTKKKVLITAFTGIAAINVGGQTIHSFFQLPIKPLLPEDDEITSFKKNSQKYKIIEKIDTIIIDEVSMLRSDILEAIDYSLRINGGKQNEIFGGKQIVLVGDIFQLPPVTNSTGEVERFIFKEVYKSHYFFDSLSYKKLNPKYFEFKQAHRQKDDLAFVDLLDNIRICRADEETLKKLNENYNPAYLPRKDEFVINLTSNNAIAIAENARKLAELPYIKHIFEATIVREFKEDRFPTSRILELKKNAQVIFIKNDKAGNWVNGTIAKIDFISNELIEIKLRDGSVHKLQKETWENRKYKYDSGKRKIVSEVIGTFTQYPIKLAWAITIHKSQGLTFDNVIIDLGTGAFVNGQVYTALSRCRKLDGITLKRKIRPQDIITDKRIINFHETEQLINSIPDLS